jgi:ribosomal protein S18 acetylase RimI-like enzyme
VHEPRFAYVLVDDDDAPIGYVLGALDSRAFEERLEREWWPELRERYPLDRARRAADQASVALIHRPPTADPAIVADYPSHLHVDLLPAAQGAGAGRRLMEALLEQLAAAGSPGVHLGVDARNSRAMGFYRALGFDEIRRDRAATFFGRRLG